MPAPLRPTLARILAAALLGGPPAAWGAGECPPAEPPEPAASTTAEAPAADDDRIQIESEGAEISRTGDATLLGHVTVRQGARTLSAETASYEAATQSFKVEGDVEYRDPDVRIRGSTGTWSGDQGGRFTNTEFELPARPARGEAGVLGLTPEGNLSLENVLFTTCPAGNDDWLFRAKSIEIDREQQQGTGRNVRLDFLGVPLLYAPYISFPAGDRRKSGFLFPTIGTSSSSGFELGIPYYFSLAPNYDALFKPTLLSRRGIDLAGTFRYLTARSRGRFDGHYLPSDQLADRDRGYAHLVHTTDFLEAMRLSASLEEASDSEYFEDFARGPEGTSITFLERRIFLEYLGEGWRAEGLLQNFQTIDLAIDPLDRPYARTPQLAFDGSWPVAGRLSAGLGGELVYFYREDGVVGARLDAEPFLSWPLRAPGYFLVPSAGYRYTAYQLDDVTAGMPDSPSRSAPTASLDAGLVFDRVAGSRGRLLQTLEPRLLYSWTPFRDQDELPIFDTGLPELDIVQLFRTNRYAGGDRLADTNQLAIGLTSRLLESGSGRQYLAATIGQQYFFDESRVTLPGESPDLRSSSDLIAEIELSAYRDWSVELAMQWDPHASNTVLGQAGVQYRPRSDTVVNLDYRYREGRVEQWETSAAWRVDKAWSLYARYVYSVKDAQSLEAFGGVEYESCCWRLRLVANRYVSNRTGEQDTSFAVQLELKGLSSVGTTSATFLERGIRGYSRDPDAQP